MTDNTAIDEARQRRARVVQHYTMATQVFLDAWKEAVKMAGRGLFKAQPGYTSPDSVNNVHDKRQLIPDLDAIRRYTGTCSLGEGLFIGALVTFYSDDIGTEILAHFDYRGLGVLANRLDLEQIEVITKLMLNHTGW